MKIFKLFTLVWVMLYMFGIAEAKNPISDGVKVFSLQNGLSVLIKEDKRFPLVSVRLFVKAGSAWEEKNEAGLSHLLEHMVFKGSKTSGAGVDKLVENAGGSMNAYTSYDMTTYLTDMPSAQWKKAMAAVRDLAFDPLLKKEDLDAEREVVLAEMKQRGDSPTTKLFHTSLGQTLQGTPYETPVIGTEEALRGITPEMMKNYISRRYNPRDMVLVVVGNINSAEVLNEAEILFGTYGNTTVLEKAQSIATESLMRGLRVKVEEGPWNKAFLSLSFPLPGMDEHLIHVVDILAHALSGEHASLLSKKLHLEEDLADSIDTHVMSFERAGALLFFAQTDAEKVPAFLEKISKILSTLKAENLDDNAIGRAKINLEDDYFRSVETVAGVAEILGHEYFYDPSGLSGERYLSSIRNASKEHLQKAINRWIRPEALSVTVMLPKQKNNEITEETVRNLMKSAWQMPENTKETEQKAASAEDKQEVLRFPGGCSVVLMPDRSLPYVSATLTFSGGELLASDDKEGLPSLTASVLTEATSTMPMEKVSEYLSARASFLGASIGLRQFGIAMDAPKRFIGDVFALAEQVIKNPAFADADTERNKKEMIASIASVEDSAPGLLGRNMQHFLFESGPFSHRSLGTPERIAKYSSDDLKAFWERQKERPWVLAVAGDFDRKQVLAFAEKLPKPTKGKLTPVAPSWNKKLSLDLKLEGRKQAVYLMLFPTIGTEDERRPSLDRLSACLSGMTGKLYTELREKQSLGYSVFPMNWASPETGYLAFGIVAAPENLPKAKDSFLKIVESVKADLFDAETMARVAAVDEAEFYKSLQSRAFRASEGAQFVLMGRPLDYALQNLKKRKAVTAEEIRTAARTFLSSGKYYEITVQP